MESSSSIPSNPGNEKFGKNQWLVFRRVAVRLNVVWLVGAGAGESPEVNIAQEGGLDGVTLTP